MRMLGWALSWEGFGEEGGGVDVGVAVNLAVAEEGGVLKAGDEAEDAGLLGEPEVVLEADEVVGVGAKVFLAELDDGVGPAAGLRVVEAGGLHGAEAEGVAARRAVSSMGRQPSKYWSFCGAGVWTTFGGPSTSPEEPTHDGEAVMDGAPASRGTDVVSTEERLLRVAGWAAAVEKQVSPLRRRSASPPVEITMCLARVEMTVSRRRPVRRGWRRGGLGWRRRGGLPGLASIFSAVVRASRNVSYSSRVKGQLM